MTSWLGLRVHDSLPRSFVTCNADGQVPAARCWKCECSVRALLNVHRLRVARVAQQLRVARRASSSFEFALRQTHAHNAYEVIARYARAETLGVFVGASVPPARSTDTSTCAPRRTGTRSRVVVPEKTPAGRTDGSAAHASYAVPSGGLGSWTLRTASPVGATTSCPGAPFNGTWR